MRIIREKLEDNKFIEHATCFAGIKLSEACFSIHKGSVMSGSSFEGEACFHTCKLMMKQLSSTKLYSIVNLQQAV